MNTCYAQLCLIPLEGRSTRVQPQTYIMQLIITLNIFFNLPNLAGSNMQVHVKILSV